MNMVRIITDTASDLEISEYEEKGVLFIPLTVIFGRKAYNETTELDKSTFYDLLTKSRELPQTAQPSPELLAAILADAKDNNNDVVCIFLSSTLSGFFQSATLSKQLAGMEQCYIIDSGTAAAGERLLVDYAVMLRDEGKTAQEIYDAVTELSQRVMIYACLDTLEYLYRGGRIAKGTRILGGALGIKPIICFDQGKLSVAATARGMKKGIQSICQLMDETKPDPRFPILVMYTGNAQNGSNLMGALRASGHPVVLKNLFNVGAAIGTHIGPNACGLAFVKLA